MKKLKEIFWNPLVAFIVFVIVFSIYIQIIYVTPKQYKGIVVQADYRSCFAKLLTRASSGNDTIITISVDKHEYFTVGQKLIVWTGGYIPKGLATTQHPF